MAYNLQGKTVIAAGVNESTNYNLLQYGWSESGEIELIGGFCSLVLWDMQHLLNFTLKHVLHTEYLKESNGTLGGIGALVLNGSADIAVPLSYVIPFRVKHLAALQPWVREPLLAIYKSPSAHSLRDIYLGTLSNSLMIATISLWMVIYAAFQVFHFASRCHLLKRLDVLLFIVAAVSEQGWYKRDPLAPNSILVLSFVSFLFGYIVLESFRATTISMLAVETELVKMFDQLYEFGYTLLTDPIQQWGKLIVPNNYPLDHFLQQIASNFVDEIDTVVKIINGRYAAVGTWDEFIPIARSIGVSDAYICKEMRSVWIRNIVSYSGFYVSKDSSLREPFNYGVIVLLQHGLNFRHYHNFLSESTLKCKTFLSTGESQGFKELGLLETSTGFLLIAIGLLSSCVVLIFETLLASKKKDGIRNVKLFLGTLKRYNIH